MSGYRGGHILRIKLKNFMTYDELEIFPKPGLNLIIGLNGSGKSSIMCAICLGLAGKPQFTGRSTQLSDFVKFGCSEANIEIELEKTSKKNVIISRTIQGDKSTWCLNSKVVTLNQIENTVREFNIDVGNLCQFLPQEKVMEFSKMDKKQRLENMLKAVGDQALFDCFEELKQIRENSLESEKEIKKLQIEKHFEELEVERLKSEVDKHEEKLRTKEVLKTLQQHKMYLEYCDIKNEASAKKKEKTALKAQKESLNVRFQEKAEKNDIKTRDSIEVEEQINILNEEIASLQELIVIRKNEILDLQKTAQDAEIYYQNKIIEKKGQEKQLSEIAKQIQDLKFLLKESESRSPVLKEKDEELSQNLDKIKTEMPSLTSTKFSLISDKSKLENSIKENMKEYKKLEIEENKKTELLKQRFKDVYEGVIWLKDNEDKFRASVYQPMFLTLKVNQEDKRKYIENLVGARDLLAFICEDKEDSKLLTQVFRLEKNLNVNIVMVPDNPIEYYSSPHLTPELKQLGVIGYLKDFIEAPNAIKRFLCHCYNLHSIPLCSNLAEQNMNLLFNHDSKISSFFTPDAKITGKRSKYGNRNLCIRRDQLKLDNFLSCSMDNTEKIRHLQTQLLTEKSDLALVTTNLEMIGMKIKDLEREENSLKEQKKEIFKKLQAYSNAEKQLDQKISLQERTQSELVSEEEEKSKLTELMQNINIEKNDIYLNISETLEKFLKKKKAKLFYYLKARIIQKDLTVFQKLQSELKKEIQEIEGKIKNVSSKVKELKNQGRTLHEDISPWIVAYQEAKKKGLYQFFGTENIGEIAKEIYRAQAYLDLNFDENDVIMDYEARKEKITKIEEQIENHKQTLAKFQEKIIEKKTPWLPQLQNHIQNINAKFSEYYKQLNYSGEVILDTCNDTDDFSNYGLQITLKYRDNEPLLELSSLHHSGGECSVAAIIFILSLQGFTHIPFRCIDEINQGMDSQNERNMYNLLAQSAKSESCLQYFLLTPKLLMNLDLIEQKDVAVHVIYNSCFLGMKLNFAEFSKFAKTRKK